MQEQVLSAAGCPLVVSTEEGSDCSRVTLKIKSPAEYILHWGVSSRPGGDWRCPPPDCWPDGTVMVDGRAARTPFVQASKDERVLSIHLQPPDSPRNLAFVLYMPKENRWVKNGRDDFNIPLPRSQSGPRPEEALSRWVPEATTRTTFTLDDGTQVATAIQTESNRVRVFLACDAAGSALLHWGLAERFPHEWKLPAENQRPAGTSVFEEKAARTPLVDREGLRWLELEFHKPADGPGPRGLRFVVFQPDTGEWLKQGGSDMTLPLFGVEADRRLSSPIAQQAAEEIVEAEVGKSSWTLMHRFNLCHDLLGKAEADPDAMALLFAWLRYSAMRQLEWQRSYNTKPRELSHSQDRLTQRLAAVWQRQAAGSPVRLWARAMFTTLGRGGEGQRVRDEILHIMHRNHLKESSGNFIEEWHQKLHNNTTPDDVVICEAYLAFLRGGGDGKVFYRTLEQGGVSRARLQSFERPIRNDPIFYADRKDTLIREFENFLRILKSLHSGTDLETAVGTARGRVDAKVQTLLDRVLGMQKGNPADLLRAIGSARDAVARALEQSKDDAARRDLLFLDLALEESLRGAVERQDIEALALDGLLPLVQTAIQNVKQSLADDELVRIHRHWDALAAKRSQLPDWPLQALGAVERLNRWVQGYATTVHNQLQPKAEYLGEACGVEKWVIPLFSEEIIRGSPVFALSRLLRRLEPALRKAAGLGGWQVVSPARTFGRLLVVENLLAVQANRYPEATVLVTDTVSGEEEIPEGVKAVLTTSQVDLVSHVAVRARNVGVLLAICFDPAELDRLKKHANRTMAVGVTPSGDVEVQEADAPLHASPMDAVPESASRAITRAPFTSQWVVAADAFSPDIVGGKSNNLNGLRNRLPDWIHLPSSVALPFGTLERVLQTDANRPIREQVQALLPGAESDPDGVLRRVRAAFLELTAPDELKASLLAVWQQAKLPVVPWDRVWRSITRVWASKWNERAYLSRRARGVPHDDLLMAVLIQQVVEADYAFVIHTANPINRNRDEIFAEVVLGLGETLVGNHPGRALGFIARKSDLSLQLVSYPSKSAGLYGKGAIFRSDSNGEDLQGFAGAGLYDSVLAEEPEHRPLDYSSAPLVCDVRFRDDLLRSIARIGLEVERALKSPQDIEGAVSGGRFFVVQTRPQVGLTER
ncbi:MAG: hypothetical protein K2R98_21295 [Gemmataceae bacterium]|nr:hypothetical protein [Gemmataceae bacterium]